MKRISFLTLIFMALRALPAVAQINFANWESAQVHPLDLTPSGSKLLAINTADGRLEVFNIASGTFAHITSVPVGVDPVSVRARSDTEAWVVNKISDSVSIVSLATFNVVATLKTDDEPADVVFAGVPERAFVSCSQANTVLVFDPANLSLGPTRLSIAGNDPRGMAVGLNTSTGRQQVYVAIFESGNRSTILGGGLTMSGGFPPNAVSDVAGPYGGTNPPPNNGAGWNPPINPAYLPAGATPAPRVGLIVKKNAAAQWMDDNSHDWTGMVSGANAAKSGRPVGWDLLDHDVAVIDTQVPPTVTYADGLMNICMAIGVNPANQRVTVVGTDATNEVRFEPVVAGRFLRVEMAMVDPLQPALPTLTDLNPHIVSSYGRTVPFTSSPQADRTKSIGDPRGIVWNSIGTRGYITGMGSNNVIIIDASGNRLQPGNRPTDPPYINVGEGPTGIVLAESSARLFVLNKFEGSISVLDATTEREITRVPIYDPTPAAIKIGRKHLYNTHLNSGLGHISCASCHVDARMDRLAWDLGDPSGAIKTFNENCPGGGCQNWHPMKGPMTTQTLQDIIGKEPHHWRGDRTGIEEFSGAFQTLLGGDAPLPTQPPNDLMQEFEDFLATIRMSPNPFRNFDNTLPTSLPLPGQFTSGRFGPAGQPLPNGNAVNGLGAFRTGNLDGVNCITCHTAPTGAGTDTTVNGAQFVPVPPGPDGEHHLALVSTDGSTNISIKIPQLRNQYQKLGFECTQQFNLAGFGFVHDGSVDSLARFISEPVFRVTSNQQIADLVALVMSFSGSEFPPRTPLEPPGVLSLDTPASVGSQLTVDGNNKTNAAVIALVAAMKGQADTNKVGWIAKGLQGGLPRGWQYMGSDLWQSDRAAETTTTDNLRLSSANGSEITFTVVLAGTQRRIGIDRDADGHFDRDELDACSNPADPSSVPGPHIAADFNCDAHVDDLDLQHLRDCQTHSGVSQALPACQNADLDGDLDVDQDDFAKLQRCFSGPYQSANPACLN